MVRKFIILILIFLYSFNAGWSQVAGQQVPITIPAIGSGPNALLYLPWDYNISGKSYPLIIFGHGLGESTLSSLPNQGLPGIITNNNPPYALENGDTVHFIVLSPTGSSFISEDDMSNGAKYLISNGIHVDTNRVYVTGLSAGARSTVGYISHQAANNYQTVYASVPMSYTLLISEMDDGYWVGPFSNFAGKGVWDFIGQSDNIGHPATAQALIDSVNVYSPGNGHLTEYNGGHCCWMTYYDPAYRENINGKMMNIYEWMLQFHGGGTTAPPPPHQPPVANAGSNQTITLPVDSVLLDGSASSDSDGTIVSYLWSQQSGPSGYTIANPDSAKTEVNGLDTGTYVFTLTVKDDSGASASANVTITVKDSVVTTPPPPHQPPVANAGNNQTITLPVDSVLLDGSASSDSDGTIASFKWALQSGPTGYNIVNPDSAKTEMNGLDTGTYVFTLTVKDDSGASASANVTITVKDSVVTTPPLPHQPPVANAGSTKTITLPVDSILLDGSASSDSDGTIISFLWSQQSGPSGYTIANPDSAKTEVNGLDTGTYVFTLTVKDDSGASASANVTITVKDSVVTTPPSHQPPVANAGSDQTITLPVDTVLLDGSGSYDSGGAITSYLWEQVSGPSISKIETSDSAGTTATGLIAGTYIYQLMVTDQNGLADSSKTTITVQNHTGGTPDKNGFYADAGPDITTTMPFNIVTLDASRTKKEQPDINIGTYHWDKISGPQQYDLPFPDKDITQVEGLTAGTYTFRVTVTISGGEQLTDTMQVFVLPDPTQPGDVDYNANTFIAPYDQTFQYGSNPGYYGNGWSDTGKAAVMAVNGVHTIRPNLPGYFVEQWGYDIRVNEFNYYTHQAGMKAITLFIGQPANDESEPGTDVFANLYTPIWDSGQNGTPVNDSNYFAVYVYNLVKRYGKNIKFWEIVNEPDQTGFWDNGNRSRSDNWWINPPQSNALLNLKAPIFSYIRMLRIAYEVIKKFYPDEYICPGGIGYPAFLDALLRYTDNPDSGKVTPEYPLTGGAYFDVVSYHIYPAYNLSYWDPTLGVQYRRYSDAAAQAIITVKDSFMNVLNDHGYNGTEYPEKPFILTEVNLSRKTFGTYWGGDSAQLNFIIKALIDAQKYDIKQLYTFQMGETANYDNADNPYQLMGLFQNLTQDPPGTQKLTDEGKAFKTTSMLLYGWQYDSTRSAALNLPPGVDGGVFRQDTSYRYVLWAKTHTDLSEVANATYSFPASLGIDSVYQYAWNYSVDPNATSEISSQNISLTGTPAFFATAPVPDTVHVPPVADAGNNQTITLPVNVATLNGSASTDADGTIVSYHWTQTSGPAQASIADSNGVITPATGLTQGVYTFTLTVTDNKGATASSNVIITVNQKVNPVPVANAGVNQVITLPLDSTMLDGFASFDPGGSIAGYHWNQQSGPSSYTFSQGDSAKTIVSNLTPGTYVFTLTVTDSSGTTSSNSVTVIVNALPHKPPVANAGSNITVTLPLDSTILNGAGSYSPDGNITSYQWNQVSGPSEAVFNAGSGASIGIFHLQKGVYVFSLTVTDNQGATGTDSVTVTVNPNPNQPPVSEPGNDMTITLPLDSVLLNGSASFDPDGKIVAYLWTQKSGPASANIVNPNSAKSEVNQLVTGTYVFTLIVTDNQGATNTDKVIVTVNPAVNRPPVANAGSNQTITLPVDSVTLDGSASSDPDGKIAFWKWKKLSGPASYDIRDTSDSKTTVTGLTAGTYIFTLTVTDDSGAASSANVTITVNKNANDTSGGTTPVTPPANQPPVANAGNNQTITLPVDSVTLDGSASSDPDGKIVSWKWKKLSGPSSYDIRDTSDSKTTVTGLTAGTYIFTLTVTDDSGAASSANVTITVNKNANDTSGGITPVTPPANQPPIAKAGNNQTITLPVDSVVLDGSASYDPDGKIVSWKWVKKSGPTAYKIISDSTAKTSVTGLIAGTYIFTLTVTDDSGAASSVNVTITVNKNSNDTSGGTTPVTPPANQPPVANAGSNQTITLPLDSVTLDGNASSDPDGKIVSWKWKEQSGPTAYKINSDSTAKTTVNGLTVGTYIFTLTVTDDSGATASANVTITVNKNNNDTTGSGDGTTPVTPPANKPPVANAGSNVNLFLPDDSTLLDGSASYDPDGKIVSWSWSQQSGPAAAAILRSDSAKTEVSSLVNGVYVFTLIVTDNGGAKDTSNVTVGVYQKPHQPPVANAGQDITIVAPQSAVTLDGSASTDPDGTIVKYHWDSMTGPTQAKLLTPDAPTTIVSGLQVGTYDFKLTVTDNNGLSSTATVSVYVMPARDTTPTTFTIYPNPVHDELHVELNKAITGMLAFRIIDVSGRILKVYQFGALPMHVTKLLDVSGLTPGIYFIQLIEDNQLRDVKKMIKY